MRRRGPGPFRRQNRGGGGGGVSLNVDGGGGGVGGSKTKSNNNITNISATTEFCDNYQPYNTMHRGLADGMNHITKHIMQIKTNGDSMGDSGGNINNLNENIPMRPLLANGGGDFNELVPFFFLSFFSYRWEVVKRT